MKRDPISIALTEFSRRLREEYGHTDTPVNTYRHSNSQQPQQKESAKQLTLQA